MNQRANFGIVLLLTAFVSAAFTGIKPLTDVKSAALTEMKTVDKKAEIKWLSMEEAYELNKKAPRKIFVDVYTDWCGWCKRMDKDTFGNAEVAEYVGKNYYAVKLNAESDRSFNLGEAPMTERQVAKQLGVSGYPTIVFIHEDFRTIEPISGYQQPDQFMKILQAFAAKSIK